MPIYLISILAIYAYCLLKVVFAAMDAPIGYEDRKGFHYGMETVRVESSS